MEENTRRGEKERLPKISFKEFICIKQEVYRQDTRFRKNYFKKTGLPDEGDNFELRITN